MAKKRHAGAHRFGPDLVCCAPGCSVTFDAHQLAAQPCGGTVRNFSKKPHRPRKRADYDTVRELVLNQGRCIELAAKRIDASASEVRHMLTRIAQGVQ